MEGQTKRGVVDSVGGRRVDGWINPLRDRMPENDRDKWPLDDKGEPRDPWQEYSTLVFRRASDASCLPCPCSTATGAPWPSCSTSSSGEAKDQPGCSPVVVLEAGSSGESSTRDARGRRLGALR